MNIDKQRLAKMLETAVTSAVHQAASSFQPVRSMPINTDKIQSRCYDCKQDVYFLKGQKFNLDNTLHSPTCKGAIEKTAQPDPKFEQQIATDREPIWCTIEGCQYHWKWEQYKDRPNFLSAMQYDIMLHYNRMHDKMAMPEEVDPFRLARGV